MTAEPARTPPGWLNALVRLMLLFHLASGVLRANGALAQKDLLLELGLPARLPGYLLAAGLLGALLSLIALVFTWRPGRLSLIALWAALTFAIGGYWVERLFLWAPEQRGGSPLFKLGLQALSVAAAALYTYHIKKRSQNAHGPGN
ncbi:MAG TPA: hypothetical protein PKL60_07490 [Anaerolineaceae bacterium]|nr:hypothetical protein [Anaerolineaceae bacterium]